MSNNEKEKMGQIFTIDRKLQISSKNLLMERNKHALSDLRGT